MPQLLKPEHPEPVLHKKSSHRDKKPLRFNQSGHCLPQLEKSLHSNEEKINKIIKKKKVWTQNLASRIRRDEASLSTVVAVLECLSERAHRPGRGWGGRWGRKPDN